MRTHSWFTLEPSGETPALSLVFAADEVRAAELARRELQLTDGAAIKVREGCALVWPEAAYRVA